MMMQPALVRLVFLCLVLSACAPSGGADSREPLPTRRMTHDALATGDARPVRSIRDIHPAEDTTSGSSPFGFIRLGPSVYFFATDTQLGGGLWPRFSASTRTPAGVSHETVAERTPSVAFTAPGARGTSSVRCLDALASEPSPT